MRLTAHALTATAVVGFVGLPATAHRVAQTMRHEPRGLVADAEIAVQSRRRDCRACRFWRRQTGCLQSIAARNAADFFVNRLARSGQEPTSMRPCRRSPAALKRSFAPCLPRHHRQPVIPLRGKRRRRRRPRRSDEVSAARTPTITLQVRWIPAITAR